MSVATQNNDDGYNYEAEAKLLESIKERRENEFYQFIDADYTWLVDTVSRIDVETLSVKLKSGQNVIIKRSIDFFKAPYISIDGNDSSSKYAEEFSPALTCIKWLMMLLYVV